MEACLLTIVGAELHWYETTGIDVATVVGGVRDAFADWRCGRWKTGCARGTNRALLCGPSTSPLDGMRTLRLLLAFCVAPIVPALLVGTYFIFSAPPIRLPLDLSRLLDPNLTKMAYLVTLIAGVPTFLVMRMRHSSRWWQYVICGAVLGCLPALILVKDYGGLVIGAVAFGAPYGALSGFAFWALGIYRRSGDAV